MTDQELLDELKRRFEDNKSALVETKNLSGQLLELNKKLEQSEKLKSHFISNIRNEIINPFSSIIELSRFLSEANSFDKEKVAKYSRLIFNEAFHLDFQMKNIFVAAEIEAGEAFPQLNKVDIVGVLEDIKAYYQDFAKDKDIIIEYFNSIPCEKKVVVSERQTIINIKSSIVDSNFIIDIIDEGIGIAEENKKMIFDRFVRVDSHINSVNRGYGLGLTISNDLTYLLNGTIEVYSELGKGSTFRIVLPVLSNNVDNADIELGGNEFLFVDDIVVF